MGNHRAQGHHAGTGPSLLTWQLAACTPEPCFLQIGGEQGGQGAQGSPGCCQNLAMETGLTSQAACKLRGAGRDDTHHNPVLWPATWSLSRNKESVDRQRQTLSGSCKGGLLALAPLGKDLCQDSLGWGWAW